MSGQDTIYRDRVRERDLDNFLVEELLASDHFRGWFLSNLPKEFSLPSRGEVRLHKSPPRAQDTRQTDVRLGWFADEALLACVLIESKVTADFQPGQAEAYRDEVTALRIQLGEKSACAVLVAPSARMRALEGAANFQAQITIEDMIEALRARRVSGVPDVELDARLAVRIDLLEALAGKRTVSDWQPVTVESKRDFAISYTELAKLVVPNLSVRPSSDGPKAITRFFDGLLLPSRFPCSVTLKHEFGDGRGMKYANLQFSGQADKYDQLHVQSALFVDGLYPVVSGKSLFVRADTPGLRPVAEEFEQQRDKIILGLKAVGRLADWFEQHGTELGHLFNISEPEPVDLAAQFETLLRSLADRAWTECHYRPGYFLDMLNERGGVATAHALLAGRPSDGFTKLWELKRLDLSIEAVALREPWRALFSDQELKIAERRLREVGYLD